MPYSLLQTGSLSARLLSLDAKEDRPQLQRAEIGVVDGQRGNRPAQGTVSLYLRLVVVIDFQEDAKVDHLASCITREELHRMELVRASSVPTPPMPPPPAYDPGGARKIDFRIG